MPTIIRPLTDHELNIIASEIVSRPTRATLRDLHAENEQERAPSFSGAPADGIRLRGEHAAAMGRKHVGQLSASMVGELWSEICARYDALDLGYGDDDYYYGPIARHS